MPPATSARLQPYDTEYRCRTNNHGGPIDVGNQTYFYNSAGSGIALSYAGPGVAGQFGAWTPIAATQTASGYDIAWQNTVTGQYTVGPPKRQLHRKSDRRCVGNSYALESLEPVFQQDLNGDGVIGLNRR